MGIELLVVGTIHLAVGILGLCVGLLIGYTLEYYLNKG